MNTYTIFAMGENGYHFAEEYIAQTSELAYKGFLEDYRSARVLFIANGSVDYVTL